MTMFWTLAGMHLQSQLQLSKFLLPILEKLPTLRKLPNSRASTDCAARLYWPAKKKS